MNIEEIKKVALNIQASINNNLLKDVMRLKKENAELRECLKEAIDHCKGCGYNDHSDKWRAALEGGSHAND